MHSGTRTLVFAAAFVTYGSFAAAQSPSAIGFRVVGAFGAADANGATLGEMVGGIRISAGRAVRRVTLAAETEMNWTSRGHVQATLPNPYREFAESRRDFVWSGLGGLEVWEPHRKLSVHVVGGISWVKPTARASVRTADVTGWSDWVAQNVTTTWAPTAGADVLFHFGDLSAGPSFRWYHYGSSTSPSLSPTDLRTVVLTFGYHF